MFIFIIVLQRREANEEKRKRSERRNARSPLSNYRCTAHLQTSRFDNNLPLHFSHSMSAEKSSMFLVLTRFLLGILAVCTIVQGPSLLNSILLRFHVDQLAFPVFISGNLIYLKSGYIHNFTSSRIRSAEYSSSSCWQI